jgi:hypothetical protein
MKTDLVSGPELILIQSYRTGSIYFTRYAVLSCVIFAI